MKFAASIDGSLIRCTLQSDRDMTAPVFCFSALVPMQVVSGGTRRLSCASYHEVTLPDLAANTPHMVVLRYEEDSFRPVNRAWLPLGAYLREGTDCVPLPPLPAGVRPAPATAPLPMEGLRLCPQPTAFTPTGDVLAAPGFAATGDIAQTVDDLARRTGLGPFLHPDGAALTLAEDTTLPAESYRLDITSNGVILTHADHSGALYGAITLLTLRTTHDGQIPCGTITDSPRFPWRGQQLDCARHFYQVDTILRLLDLMALLKLNRFHWHFADDEAFRLELDSLPELARSHYRGEGELLPGLFGGGIRAGGSYSRADVARVLAHARALGIEVMPEIEVPAHAFALAKVFPATRDPGDNGSERSVQGYGANVMNPAMEESWRVWNAMVDEIASLFPFEVLHLGCDELPADTWRSSPAARALMDREGLDTTDDLQGWTMFRLAERVAERGKTPGAWEEAMRGKQGIGHDAVIFSWTGQGPGLDAARAGHKVVMMPGQHTYLDMAHTDDPDDWGAAWAAFIPLSETINWDPVPDDAPELAANILGVEGAFWGEFTTQDSEMEPMLAPRILGIATMGWQPRGSADSATLSALASQYRRIFDAMGWQMA